MRLLSTYRRLPGSLNARFMPTSHGDQEPAIDLYRDGRVRLDLVSDRAGLLCDLVARHNCVAHIGCTDSPYTEMRLRCGDLLHTRLRPQVRLVGFDIDSAALELLATRLPGSELVSVDVAAEVPVNHRQAYDLVLAGEVLEHVANPGAFLEGCRGMLDPRGRLCVTVPNACSPKIAVRALAGFEAVHPDHHVYYGPRTLTRTLETAGFKVQWMATYLAKPGSVGQVLNLGLSLSSHLRRGPIGDGLVALATLADAS